MALPSRNSQRVRFGEFELDLSTRELWNNGTKQTLAPQPFQVLQILIENRGQLVGRDALVKHLWPSDTFVDYEQGLKKAVNRLREALKDSAERPRFIETLPRQGYRFIGNLEFDTAVRDRSADPVVVMPKRVPEEPEAKVIRRKSIPTIHLLWVSATVIAAICVATYLWLRKEDGLTSPIQAVAVLPLENLSGDDSQDYLTEGLTDEIITDLAKLGGVRVISRTSVMRYKGTRHPIPEIARELNVDAVVEGSYERLGDRVRLRVQLIRGATDQHIWAEGYDRELGDIFNLESEVARDIAVHIKLSLGQSHVPALAKTHPMDPQAFQDYLLGRHYLALRTKEGLHKALEYFGSAIQRDPNDARSYAGLADCYLVLPFLTEMRPAEGFEKARQEIGRALALDPNLPEAHLANAAILMYHDWNLLGAEREFRRTLDLNPNDSTAHQWYGEVLVLLGRNEEAIREEQTALALDPLSAVIHHEMGGILRDAGRYDDAVRAYQETLKIDPQFFAAYWEMARAYRRQGKFLDSIRAFRQGAEGIVREYRLDPAVIFAIDEFQSAYANSGRIGYFRQSLKVNGYLPRPSYYLARDYAQLGDKESALVELRRSYQNHDPEALWMFNDTELESLRSDPRYQELVLAIGFH